MKKIIFVIMLFLSVTDCFAQDTVITKKMINNIISDIKSDNLISYYKRHPSYDTILSIYLENGKEKQYNYIRSNAWLYKENERIHKKNIFDNFTRFKSYYWDEKNYRNIKLNWPDIEIQDVFINKPRIINNDMYVLNKHVSTDIIILLIERTSHKQYIIDAESMFSISGKFISFYIENVYADFSAIKNTYHLKKKKQKKKSQYQTSLSEPIVQMTKTMKLKRLKNFTEIKIKFLLL